MILEWRNVYELAIKYHQEYDFSNAKECIDEVLKNPEAMNDAQVLIDAAKIYFSSDENFFQHPFMHYLNIDEILNGKFKTVIELIDKGLDLPKLSEKNKSILYSLKGNVYNEQSLEITNIINDSLKKEDIDYYVNKSFELEAKSKECFGKISDIVEDDVRELI